MVIAAVATPLNPWIPVTPPNRSMVADAVAVVVDAAAVVLQLLPPTDAAASG